MSGGMCSQTAITRTAPPTTPTSAPVSGKTRAARRKSGLAPAVGPSHSEGSRVRKAVDARRSSRTASASPRSIGSSGVMRVSDRSLAAVPPGVIEPPLPSAKNCGRPTRQGARGMDQTTAIPFDDIRALVKAMPGPDLAAVEAVTARDAVLTKPPGSLGRLEEIVAWLAAWQGRAPPVVNRPVVAIFAGNHGVTARGVSAYPAAVTEQMVANFARGGAAINQICLANDLGLKVLDLALDIPTGDITVEAAMDEADCARTMAFGMEAVAGGTDLLCIGEMGIGNTTIAAAIFAALFGGPRRRLGRPRHRRRRRGDGAEARRRRGRARLPPRPPVATRSRCSAGSAAASSRPWPGRSWPRATSACR